MIDKFLYLPTRKKIDRLLTLSNVVNNLCLISIFSTIASITKSASLTDSSGLVTPLILCNASATNFSPSCGLSLYNFLATRPKFFSILACAFLSTFSLTSTKVTWLPLCAETC